MGEIGSIVDEVEGVEATDGVTPTPTAPTATGPTVDRSPAVLLAGGTTVSFGDFYADTYSDLVRLATLLSGSADTAPDLVQDCFVRLHGHWSSVREPLPYIRRSVVHACASHHRRNAMVRRNPPPDPRDSELGADELEDALGGASRPPAVRRGAPLLRRPARC